jgi:hypothetical protein
MAHSLSWQTVQIDFLACNSCYQSRMMPMANTQVAPPQVRKRSVLSAEKSRGNWSELLQVSWLERRGYTTNPMSVCAFESADPLKSHCHLIDADGSWPLAFLRAHYMQYYHPIDETTLPPPRRLFFSQIHSEKFWHNPVLWSLPHILFPGLGVI